MNQPIYIRLTDEIVIDKQTELVPDSVFLDWDEGGKLLGIEVLDAESVIIGGQMLISDGNVKR